MTFQTIIKAFKTCPIPVTCTIYLAELHIQSTIFPTYKNKFLAQPNVQIWLN